MATATAPPSVASGVTAEQLLRMPDDGWRYELVRGELRKMSPAGEGHGAIGMNLAIALGHYVKANHLGRTYLAETGFVLSQNPDTVRAPDIAFVRRERLPDTFSSAFFVGPPDLAVEVTSPGDTATEVEEKAASWLQAGTQIVWVVNPQRRTVAIHRTGHPVTVLRDGDELDGGDVVPGFLCAVAEMFAV